MSLLLGMGQAEYQAHMQKISIEIAESSLREQKAKEALAQAQAEREAESHARVTKHAESVMREQEFKEETARIALEREKLHLDWSQQMRAEWKRTTELPKIPGSDKGAS